MALNFFHSEKMAEAIQCIDNAITLCSPTSLSTLAHCFYHRGRIFESLISKSATILFPTSFPYEADLSLNPPSPGKIKNKKK